MASPKKTSKPSSKVVKSLPKKAGKDSAVVKGGAMRRGGDDDLKDLEVDQLR
ncbi:MAG: hypothetical protein IT457_09905 [Planctomycetes bacterium]|nr:hypothetical protein [Planctomycetota bacterium]